MIDNPGETPQKTPKLSVVPTDILSSAQAQSNVIAEKQLVGAILVDNARIADVGDLSPDHFLDETLGHVYAAAKSLVADGIMAGPLSLSTASRLDGLTGPGGTALHLFLMRLAKDWDTCVSAIDCAQVIKDLARKRAVMRAAGEIARDIQEGKDPNVVIADAHAWFDRVKSTAAPSTDLSGFEMFEDIEVSDDEEYRVEDILPAKGIGSIYGPSGKAKTFTMLDIAMSVARGTRFAGRYETNRGSVVYIPLEGQSGFKKRIAAYRQAHDVTDANFATLKYPLDVCDPASVAGLIAKFEAWKAVKGTYPALVIFDTLNQAMPGRKENAPEDMGAAIHGMQAIQAAIDGLVVAVHHTGKDEEKGARGHSSLYAALNAALVINAKDNQPTELVADKVKDGRQGFVIGTFDLEEHVVGRSKKGKDITSAVLRWSDQPVGMKPARAPPPAARRALAELHELIIDGHVTIASRHARAPDGSSLAKLSEWRSRCEEHRLSTGGQDGERKAFERAVKALDEAKFIARHGVDVWLVPRT